MNTDFRRLAIVNRVAELEHAVPGAAGVKKKVWRPLLLPCRSRRPFPVYDMGKL